MQRNALTYTCIVGLILKCISIQNKNIGKTAITLNMWTWLVISYYSTTETPLLGMTRGPEMF